MPGECASCPGLMTIPREVTVAAGRFAPGHLGEAAKSKLDLSQVQRSLAPDHAPSTPGATRVLRWTQIGPTRVQFSAVNGRDPQRSAEDDTILQGHRHQPPHKRGSELTGGQAIACPFSPILPDSCPWAKYVIATFRGSWHLIAGVDTNHGSPGQLAVTTSGSCGKPAMVGLDLRSALGCPTATGHAGDRRYSPPPEAAKITDSIQGTEPRKPCRSPCGSRLTT